MTNMTGIWTCPYLVKKLKNLFSIDKICVQSPAQPEIKKKEEGLNFVIIKAYANQKILI